MVKIGATWEGVKLVESDEGDIQLVEGNSYFPPSGIKMEYFKPNSTTTTCPWKGVAKYYDITVNGKTIEAGAWYYPEPKPAAQKIKGFVAFYTAKGVKVGPQK